MSDWTERSRETTKWKEAFGLSIFYKQETRQEKLPSWKHEPFLIENEGWLRTDKVKPGAMSNHCQGVGMALMKELTTWQFQNYYGPVKAMCLFVYFWMEVFTAVILCLLLHCMLTKELVSWEELHCGASCISGPHLNDKILDLNLEAKAIVGWEFWKSWKVVSIFWIEEECESFVARGGLW